MSSETTCDRSPTAVHPLWGRGLRLLLLNELLAVDEMTVDALAKALQRHGYPLHGRPSKLVSDALRAEIRRGRVVRVGRGRYRRHQLSPTMERRTRIFASCCHFWMAAVRAGQPPPPVPPVPARRRSTKFIRNDPDRAPWETLGWLWCL